MLIPPAQSILPGQTRHWGDQKARVKEAAKVLAFILNGSPSCAIYRTPGMIVKAVFAFH
jgi:hypothetical protein